MKKLICVLLCFVMLGTVLVGCQKNEPDTPAETTGDVAPSTDGTSGTEDTEGGIRKEMVIEDFSVNGTPRDFTMLVRANRNHYLYVEEDSTDRVESATYKRNRNIEANFGVKFIRTEIDGASAANWTPKLLSADTNMDLAVPDYWWLLEQQDVFINLYEREELQFNQEYWYSGWNDATTINNKLYTVVGDASLEIWENIEMVFYNKDMAAQIPDLNMYELVDKGEWTIDKMKELSLAVSMNLDDGDTSNDVYGALYDTHSSRSQLFSAGLKLLDVTESGAIDIIAESRTLNVDICEAVTNLVHANTTYLNKNTARSDINLKVNMFNGDRVMFYATALYLGYYINGADNPALFGVVPMPKMTVEDEYVTTSYGVSVFAIPKNAVDPHFSTVILDALNYYSEETTLSAFYEKAMKGQIAEGADDARMMDIARDTMYFDLGWILDQGGTINVFGAFQKAVINNEELASHLPGAMESSTTALADLIAFYNK